jgi:hypothetical protein
MNLLKQFFIQLYQSYGGYFLDIWQYLLIIVIVVIGLLIVL